MSSRLRENRLSMASSRGLEAWREVDGFHEEDKAYNREQEELSTPVEGGVSDVGTSASLESRRIKAEGGKDGEHGDGSAGIAESMVESTSQDDKSSEQREQEAEIKVEHDNMKVHTQLPLLETGDKSSDEIGHLVQNAQTPSGESDCTSYKLTSIPAILTSPDSDRLDAHDIVLHTHSQQRQPHFLFT